MTMATHEVQGTIGRTAVTETGLRLRRMTLRYALSMISGGGRSSSRIGVATALT